jgi:hypothetical protein
MNGLLYWIRKRICPQPDWVKLTNEEIDYIENNVDPALYRHFARAIEVKLKEKNT